MKLVQTWTWIDIKYLCFCGDRINNGERPRHGCATLVFKWTAPQYTHAVARWSPLSARDIDRFEESLGCQSFRMRSCLDLRQNANATATMDVF